MPEPLVIVPSPFARVGLAVLECGFAVGLVALARPRRGVPLTIQEWTLVAFAAVELLGGIEFPGRKIVIHESSIRERRWFHWRSHELPHRVIVGRNARGRTAIAEAPTGKIVFTFVREFGEPAKLRNTLSCFFRKAGRLDEEI